MQRIHVTIRSLKREDSVLYFPPEAFGPFRVLHQIGVGTLGPVFRAYEPSGDRLVAIKVLRLGFTPEQAAALVGHLEALVAIDVRHPNIAAPVAVGIDAGEIYLAQEYAMGESLDTVRQRGPLSTEEVLRIVESAAAAIDFAASRGVHHGALHPRDILVSTDGVRVTGFGIAGALSAMFAKPPIRPLYAPPGEPSDVYSLSAIAFEALTGTGVSADNLKEAESTHGAELRGVFAAALFGESDGRFERAGDFADALGAPTVALAAPVAPAPPVVSIAPAPDRELVRSVLGRRDEPTARRWPIVAAFLGFAVLVAVSVGLVLRSPTPVAHPDPEPVVGETTVDVPRSLPPTAERPTAPDAAPSLPAPAPSRSVSGEVARPQPPVSGSVLVRSTPADADVMVNGRARGKTPLAVRDLAPGSYTIRVARDGYASDERTLQLTARRPAVSTTFDLQPVIASGGASASAQGPSADRSAGQTAGTRERGVGSLNVRSRPAGARVLVNDRLVGLTPLAIPGLPAGPAAVRIEMDGYQTWATTVRVSAGAQAGVSASLERK